MRPSDAAVGVAADALRPHVFPPDAAEVGDVEYRLMVAQNALAAAYTIIRAEVIAEVVAALDGSGDMYLEGAVDFIERKFGAPNES